MKQRETEIEQIVFNKFLLFYILYATFLLLYFLGGFSGML